jgi:hypothetical protein
MNTTSKTSEGAQPPHKSRTRSPNYPYISLREAIDRAKDIWTHEKRNPAPLTVLAGHWNLTAKSSSLHMTAAALRKYGLLEEVEGGKERLLKLSSAALNIILHDQEDAPERIAVLKRCALSPKIHAQLWQQFNGELPSDATLSRHLIVEQEFNPDGVDAFIREFRDTIAFAKLTVSDKITIAEPAVSETAGAEKTLLKSAMEREKQGVPGTSAASGPTGFGAIGTMSVMREFTVPLSAGSVFLKVPYPMQDEDFQLFIDTLNLWKKRLVHALAPVPPAIKLPAKAIWKNKDTDKPVKIVALMGERDGVMFYQSDDGTGIPASQLKF